jgi:hypothetical protein
MMDAIKLNGASCNTKDFEGIEGLQVINPWQTH